MGIQTCLSSASNFDAPVIRSAALPPDRVEVGPSSEEAQSAPTPCEGQRPAVLSFGRPVRQTKEARQASEQLLVLLACLACLACLASSTVLVLLDGLPMKRG